MATLKINIYQDDEVRLDYNQRNDTLTLTINKLAWANKLPKIKIRSCKANDKYKTIYKSK